VSAQRQMRMSAARTLAVRPALASIAVERAGAVSLRRSLVLSVVAVLSFDEVGRVAFHIELGVEVRRF